MVSLDFGTINFCRNFKKENFMLFYCWNQTFTGIENNVIKITFRKILKKHDKLMESTSGAEWREKHVESAPFYTNKQISNFISQTEVSHFQ